MKKSYSFAAASLLILCITTSVWAAPSAHVASKDTPKDIASVKFEPVDQAWRKEGTFPILENIANMKPGLTKQEMYTAFGKPHFSEGLLGVRQWDYIFKFNVGADVKVCQYQIHFDEKYLVANTYWDRPECASYAAIKPSEKIVERERVVEKLVYKEVATQAPAQVQSHMVTLMSDTLFDFGKSNLRNPGTDGAHQIKAAVQSISGAMIEVQNVKVVGYTDRIGTDAANMKLSQDRAKTVRDALVKEGVDGSKITAEGKGSTDSIATCPGAATKAVIKCLAPNRRVEVVVTGVKKR